MKNIFKSITLLLGTLPFFFSCTSQGTTPLEIGDNESLEETTTEEIRVTESQFDLAKMKLGQWVEHSFPSIIRAAGRVEIPSKNQLRISSYAGGYVTYINLIPGQAVRKGQVLFTLENPEFVQMQQDYLEAKEQLTYLKSDYERQKTLAAENVASQKNFLKAESDYRVTLAKMEGMKKRLSLITIDTDNISPQNMVSSISIRAPASAFVTEVAAMKGMFLNPTDVAVELLNTDDIHIELSVFEKDILKVKEGQNITFRIPDASPETFEAEVHLIGKNVDEEKRVVRVHGHLKHKEDKVKLVAGMYVDAEIITEDNTTKGLPESAIVTEDGMDFVLVHTGQNGDSKVFERKTVSVGQRKNGFVEIKNNADFTGNETILLEGAFNLIGIE